MAVCAALARGNGNANPCLHPWRDPWRYCGPVCGLPDAGSEGGFRMMRLILDLIGAALFGCLIALPFVIYFWKMVP